MYSTEGGNIIRLPMNQFLLVLSELMTSNWYIVIPYISLLKAVSCFRLSYLHIFLFNLNLLTPKIWSWILSTNLCPTKNIANDLI